MLRLTRLRVKDEVDNGLAYYGYTFLAEIPRLQESLERLLRAEYGAAGYLRKPFVPEKLRDVLSPLLGVKDNDRIDVPAGNDSF